MFEKIKDRFEQINLDKLSIHLAIVSGVLLLFNFLFNYLEILPSYLSIKLFFSLFIASGVFYFVQLIKKIPRGKRDKSSIIYYFSHFFLLSLVVIAVNQFLKRQIIIDNLFYISVLSIGFGFLTFYAHRDKVEREIEDEKDKEDKVEKKRYEEFGEKFPFWDKIWGVRRIVRWMHKEGWGYSLGLVAIVVLGFVLRVWNLDYLPPIRDELYHLVAAKRYFLEGIFNYPRASFLTYLIGIFFKIKGGTSLFLARLIPVVFSVASTILLYDLGKFYSKKTGIIASYLFIICPLAVGMARYIREYEIYLFFALLFVFLLIKVINKLEKIRNFIFILILINLLFLGYYFLIERALAILEILAFIWITFITIFLFNKKIREKIKRIDKKIIFAILFLVIFIGIYLFIYFSGAYSGMLQNGLNLSGETAYKEMFFNPLWDYRGGEIAFFWYSNNLLSPIFIISIFLFPILFFKTKEIKYYFIYFLNFILILFLLTCVAERYFASRYIYIICGFFILTLSIAIYQIIELIKNIKLNKIFSLLIIFSFLLLLFNPTNLIKGLYDETPGGLDTKTDLIHYDIELLFSFLNENGFSEEDILITSNVMTFTYYYNYSFIQDDVDLLRRYDYKKDVNLNSSSFNMDYAEPYSYYYLKQYTNKCRDNVCFLEEKERISKIIDRYEKGWIVIDKDRNRNWNANGFLLENFYSNKIKVNYLGSTRGYRGFDIYKWGDF